MGKPWMIAAGIAAYVLAGIVFTGIEDGLKAPHRKRPRCLELVLIRVTFFWLFLIGIAVGAISLAVQRMMSGKASNEEDPWDGE